MFRSGSPAWILGALFLSAPAAAQEETPEECGATSGLISTDVVRGVYAYLTARF